MKQFFESGWDYAKARPSYPPSLAQALSSYCASHVHAVDIGCGTGQLTEQLVPYFERVTGVDLSLAQLAAVDEQSAVVYQHGCAEATGLAAQSVDCVVAAQSAHWFDLPQFYHEVRRIVKPGGIVALICYTVPELTGQLGRRFSQFYWQEMGPYWPESRRVVEQGYQGLDFPFQEITLPNFFIHRSWLWTEFYAYIQTWSAMREVEQVGAYGAINSALSDLATRWGTRRQTVSWAIRTRVGEVY